MASSRTIETGVDELIRLLKDRKPTDIDTLAKEMNTNSKTVEVWANLLMEQGTVGIDYKLTKPYIYLIEKDKKEEAIEADESYNEVEEDKPEEYSWKSYMKAKLEEKKGFFYKQAQKRKLKNPDELWEKYKKRIIDEL